MGLSFGIQYRSGLWPPFVAALEYLSAYLDYYGLAATVTSGYRSNQEQAALYSQGRTPEEVANRVHKHGTGGSVTDAPPGYSAHNYGLAIDIDSDDLADVMAVAKAMGFGTVSWDPDHLEWPSWQSLVNVNG